METNQKRDWGLLMDSLLEMSTHPIQKAMTGGMPFSFQSKIVAIEAKKKNQVPSIS